MESREVGEIFNNVCVLINGGGFRPPPFSGFKRGENFINGLENSCKGFLQIVELVEKVKGKFVGVQ